MRIHEQFLKISRQFTQDIRQVIEDMYNQQFIHNMNQHTLQDILDFDMELNIIRCTDGDFILDNFTPHKIENLQVEPSSDTHSRVEFNTFDNNVFMGFKNIPKYFFVEEKSGYIHTQNLKNDRIIHHNDTMEIYIQCQKVEKL